MTLFAPDLYRNFALGFAGTALALGVVMFDDLAALDARLVPEAQAAERPAPVNQDIDVAEEFLIVDQPEETP